MRSVSSPPQGTPSNGESETINRDWIDIDELHEKYLDVIFSYVFYRVPNHAEAEDITAETFLAAMTALVRFRGDCSPKAWLLGIARQKIAEAARRHERKLRRELPESDLTDYQRETLGLLFTSDTEQLPEDVTLAREAQGVIRKLLASLPDPQREALLLQVEQNLSIREIARVMGRTEAAANSLLQRGRASIFRQGERYFKC